MINNENRDKEKAPRGSKRYNDAPESGWWRSLAAERVIVVPCVLAGGFLGLLGSVWLFGIDAWLLPLIAAAFGGVGGAAFGKFVVLRIRKAVEAKRNARQQPQPQLAVEPVEAPAQAAPALTPFPTPGTHPVAAEGLVAASEVPPRRKISLPVTLPGKRTIGRIGMICGGLGAISFFGLVGGLVPASFGSVAFTLLLFGAGALSYVLGKRAKS